MFSSSASRSIASSAVDRTIAGMRLEPGRGGRAQPPLAHHQLVAAGVRIGAHDDRLQHAELADRVGQLGQRVLVEDLARLLGVGVDLVDGQFGEASRRAPADRLGCRSLRRPASAAGRRARPPRRRAGSTVGCGTPRRPATVRRSVPARRRGRRPVARSGSAPRARVRGRRAAACCSLGPRLAAGSVRAAPRSAISRAAST